MEYHAISAAGTAAAAHIGRKARRWRHSTYAASGATINRLTGRLNTAKPSGRPVRAIDRGSPRVISQSANVRNNSDGPCCHIPRAATLIAVVAKAYNSAAAMAVERRFTSLSIARKKNATDAAVTKLAEAIDNIERCA